MMFDQSLSFMVNCPTNAVSLHPCMQFYIGYMCYNLASVIAVILS